MSRIYRDATLTPGKGELVTGWIVRQRWYPNKGHNPVLVRVGGFRLEDPEGEVGMETLLFADASLGADAPIYQVPVTYRGAPLAGGEHALIGTLEHSVLGTRWVYDAPHDPVYAAALLDLLLTGGTSDLASGARGSLAPATGRRSADDGWPRDGEHLGAFRSRVLSGEQSNTSIIVTADPPATRAKHRKADPGSVSSSASSAASASSVSSTASASSASSGSAHDPGAGATGAAPRAVIIKVFRALSAGDNPDVVLQSALTVAGSPYVPAVVGHVSGAWFTPASPDDPAGPPREVHGDLAFAQEFLPGTQDAWRVAAGAIERGEDFTARARALGEATADVHRTLARVLPMAAATDERRAALVASWRSRAEAALGAAPELTAYAAGIETVFARATGATWPLLQRVHGDYHLGQVIDVPGRGWVLLDFEGEPLRPLAERALPDLALRDVAGMLRSFDYAAGSHALTRSPAAGSDATAAQWATAAREAFLAGYAERAGDPRDDTDQAALLAALELDKALYEVVYEARNRPTWLPIPLSAIDRLAAPRPVGAGLASGGQSDPQPPIRERRKEASMPAPTEPTGAGSAPAHAAVVATAAEVSTEATTAEATTAKPTTAESAGATTPGSGVPGGASDALPDVRPASWDELGLLVHGGHGNPHGVLGAHPWNGGVTVRALRPMARSVRVELPDGSTHAMTHDFEGVWQIQLDIPEVTDYRLLTTYADGVEHQQDDPFRFLPTVGEIDLHLIGEGRHEELWRVLGAHIKEYDGPMGLVRGTSFAVWAPNARAIRVVGDFNHWDGTSHPMRAMGSTGIWELFVPGVAEGATYKFEILGADGYRRTKADPMAQATECPPKTASVITRSQYEWNDEAWLAARAKSDPINSAMSIYEVHLGSWRQGLSYVEAAEHLLNYVRDAGFTHVEFLPLAEHPYGPSWGYQVTGYYAPTSRFGSPDELRYLIDALHQADIGVIMDWVPAHFPKDGFALGRFDGQPLYEHQDPRRGEHKDWGTYIFDFGRPQVRNFLVANASFWIEEFHVDGLRVDAVASMLYLDYSREDGEWYPNQYGGRENLEAMQLLQETNATLYKRYPGVVTLAEESTSWGGVTKPTYMGGLGFGLKWNMGWMHDALGYVETPAVYRQYHHHAMTFAMIYQYSENFCLPISHDEVVYGKGSMIRKMPGDWWEQFAQLRAFYAYMWTFPGKQLLFMGSEFAQYAEWADSGSLDWWLLDHEPHWRMHKMVKDLNGLYKTRPALWELDNHYEGFSWIDANDASGNTYSWLRYGREREDGERPTIATVVNFSGTEHHQYRIGLPKPGVWRELLNSDSEDYFGGGSGNMGQIFAEEVPWHGQPYSALVMLPKMTAILFEPSNETPDEAAAAIATATASGAGVHVRASTQGVQRPELKNAPVTEDDAVDSGLGELPPISPVD